MKSIAVITDKFLPSGRGFIYDEITSIQNYNMMVLTEERYNEQEFPYNNIYICKEKSNVNLEFLQIIKQYNIQLIHVQFGTSALQYLPLKELTGLPFIATFQGYDASKEIQNDVILHQYQHELFLKADHLITVSQKLKDNLVNVGCPEDKITVLWNGIDLNNFCYRARIIEKDRPIKILCIARMVEKKGLKYLIQAFSKVAALRPNTALVLVGDGPLKAQLMQLIIDLRLEAKVEIRDSVPYNEIPDIMCQCHIFCLPSVIASNGDEEGTPNVLKEAQATGMPVVATNHSGINHVIQDKKNGFLVRERDILQLTQRLVHLIDHPELWQPMGCWGRKHVEQYFDKYIQAKKLEKIYRKILSQY